MKHADPLDRAQAVTELALSNALNNRVIYSGESATHCTRCDEPIPEARRKAIKGCQFCVDCQSIKERVR